MFENNNANIPNFILASNITEANRVDLNVYRLVTIQDNRFYFVKRSKGVK